MTLLVPELLASNSYQFQRWRAMLADLEIQEGVVNAGDFAVAQRAAGANLSVDVAAGAAWIQGDDIARQGLYHLVNDAVVNVPGFAAGHATHPRIDQLIARIYDSQVLGASDVPALEIVAGTPTAGATLDNRTGAAALPNGATRLADILVPATAGTVTTANIRDRRRWARGISAFLSTASGYDVTNAPTNIDAANLYPRIECDGGLLRMIVKGSVVNATPGDDDYLVVAPIIDGAEQLRSRKRVIGNTNDGFTMLFMLQPAAGSHRIGINVSKIGTADLNLTVDTAQMMQITLESWPNRQNAI